MSRWTNCYWVPIPTTWHWDDGRVESVMLWFGPSDDHDYPEFAPSDFDRRPFIALHERLPGAQGDPGFAVTCRPVPPRGLWSRVRRWFR